VSPMTARSLRRHNKIDLMGWAAISERGNHCRYCRRSPGRRGRRGLWCPAVPIMAAQPGKNGRSSYLFPCPPLRKTASLGGGKRARPPPSPDTNVSLLPIIPPVATHPSAGRLASLPEMIRQKPFSFFLRRRCIAALSAGFRTKEMAVDEV